MAMLDKRLKRMEERVIKMIPKDEQQGPSNITRAVVKPALPSAPAKTPASKKRSPDAAFHSELDQWAGPYSVEHDISGDASDIPERDPLQAQNIEEHSLLIEGADKLPSKEVQQHLAEVFFDYVYGQSYHLLHKPSFMRRLAQGAVPPVLMLAVCAISARFSSHLAVRSEPTFLRGEAWASAARDISLRRYDTPNITILIVYLLLGLHEFGTCQGGRSWMFGGMAQRMAYALQLHRDLDHDPKDRGEKTELTSTDREIRRRTVWSCFLMDRFNSSGTDRPIFIGQQYIEAQLPIKESYFQMEITGITEDLDGNLQHSVSTDTDRAEEAKRNMGVAAYQIRLIAILGKLVHYYNLGGKNRETEPMWAEGSVFQGLRRDVQAWKKALPENLQYNEENLKSHASEKISNQFVFMHISYNQIVLFLHRFALPNSGSRPTSSTDAPKDFIAEAARLALEAANTISVLVEVAMDHCVVAPFAGYCAFFSSTVHIYGAFSGIPKLEATSKENLARNIKYLIKMKKYWGMFHFVTEDLRDLYRRHADASKIGSKALGPKEQDKGIFQYGDWFDRYPHGVSGTDYDEPSVKIKREPGSDAVLGQKSDLQTVEEFFSKSSSLTRAGQSSHQPAQRKTKSRRSKSETKSTNDVAAQRQAVKQAHSAHGHPQMALDHTPVIQDMQSYLQQPQSNTFPAPFQLNQNSSMPAMPQQFMSQLDRQMVLNSYAGINAPLNDEAALLQSNTDADRTLLNFPGQDQTNSFDMNNFGNNVNNNVWGDPSTAWFMPFNMDPPTIGEDSNMFNAGYDWSDLGGFADIALPIMPPAGGTPGGDIDMVSGRHVGHRDAGGDRSGPDGMQRR